MVTLELYYHTLGEFLFCQFSACRHEEAFARSGQQLLGATQMNLHQNDPDGLGIHHLRSMWWLQLLKMTTGSRPKQPLNCSK